MDFPSAGGRAGDDDAGERLLRREERDVRAQDAEGLQEALLAASRKPAARDARHAREHGDVQLAGEVVLAPQARVEPIAQKREAGAQEEREDEHDRRVERRPGPDGRRRRLRAVGHGDLAVRLCGQLLLRVLGERRRVDVGEVGRLLGAVALRGDDEQLRVGDRAEGHPLEQVAGRLVTRKLLGDEVGDVLALDQLGIRAREDLGGLDRLEVVGRVAPVADEEGRLGLVDLGQAAAHHVGGQGRDEDRQDDDPLPSPEGDEELIRRQVTPC